MAPAVAGPIPPQQVVLKLTAFCSNSIEHYKKNGQRFFTLEYKQIHKLGSKKF